MLTGTEIRTDRLEVVGNGGVTLRGQAVVPTASRAVIALAHGYGEHIGRYRHVIDVLSGRNYAVFAVDHRGHGASDGPRASIQRFDDFVDDFHLLVARAQEQLPDVPLYVLGHSMGGLIATRYALRHQRDLAGLVLSGPALIVREDIPEWQRQLLIPGARIAPNVAVIPLPPGLLSRDPEVERRFNADPLSYRGKVRLGLSREMDLAAEDARARFAELTLPLLTMHGAEDRFTSPRGSELLYERARSEDKTLKLWPDDRHEIFNELDGEAVIAFLGDWLDARTVAPLRSVRHSAR